MQILKNRFEMIFQENISQRVRAIQAYYGATLLFYMLDRMWGMNVRISGLIEYPHLTGLYYLFCALCLGGVLWKPQWSVAIVIVESVINITILAAGILFPVNADVFMGIADLNGMKQRVINFVLVGSMGVWSIYGALYTLRSTPEDPNRPPRKNIVS